MNRREIKKADVAELVTAYIEAAAAHGRASAEGDYKTANPRANELIAIYHELRARGPEVQAALLPLLDSDDPHVRLSVAAHALEFAPNQGESVLEGLVSLPGMVGLDAQMTLREWRRGALHFP
jgi:hypothetical protein